MRDQHKLQTLRWTMRRIVEDILWEGGVLTTGEIYRGVKAKHAQLRQLLPPRWKEKVRQILEAHCISHERNSWFLEKPMRRIVEDVLWEGGVLTTDEIYRGVKAKHAQLRQLLPPR